MFDPDLTGRTFLLTGAAGFIGSHLLQRLLRAGAVVHATSREVQPCGEPTLHWHQIDLTDGSAVQDMVCQTEPEVILHLASHVSGSRDLDLVLPTFHANLASTVYLLTAAAQVGCARIVLAGSLEEPESDEPAPIPASPYAAAKAAATNYASMFRELYATPVIVARLFMVYGPAQPDITKLIPYVILSRLRGEKVHLSSGRRPVDWVYVHDVVEGLLRIAVLKDLKARRVDLGSGELNTIRQVVEKLFEIVSPGETPEFGGLPDRPLEQIRRARAQDTEKLLGWRPETGLAEGLAVTVDYYRNQLSTGALR